jgi:ketosteroid isomerase-like protein
VRNLVLLAAAAASVASLSAQLSPQAAVEDLLNADRAFSVASDKTDLVTGISAMFADEVLMPNPAGLAVGKPKAIEALRANPASAGARIVWMPLRAGISGDGRHGFTAGLMALRPPDGGPTGALKYLAYWEKQQGGWRVLVYKRVLAKAPPSPLKPMANVSPKQIVASAANAATIEQYRKTLADAETAFSNEAQKIGMSAAFTKYGSPEAIHLGSPDVPGFLLGNQEIGKSIGGGAAPTGSPVSWGADKTIVAASGDFGVTIGYIVPNASGADGKPQPRRAFFTIWRRDSPKDPWRYIAE